MERLIIKPAVGTDASIVEDNRLITGSGVAYYMDGDDKFLYVAHNTLGLQTWHYDDVNGFTLDSSIAGSFTGVHRSDDFLFASGGGNVYSYTVDVSGVLSLIDTETGPIQPKNSYYDGNWLFVADSLDRVQTYAVDASGFMTLQFTKITDSSLNSPSGLISDGSILHVCHGITAERRAVSSYTIAANGSLTAVDQYYAQSTNTLLFNSTLKLNNGRLYVGMMTGSVFDVDAAGNYTPYLLYPSATNSGVSGIELDDQYFYMGDAVDQDLYVFDRDNPSSPPIFDSDGGFEMTGNRSLISAGPGELYGINGNGYLFKYTFTPGIPGQSSIMRIDTSETSKLIIDGSAIIPPEDPSVLTTILETIPENEITGIQTALPTNTNTWLAQTFLMTQNQTDDFQIYLYLDGGNPGTAIDLDLEITGVVGDVSSGTPYYSEIIGSSNNTLTLNENSPNQYYAFNFSGVSLKDASHYGAVLKASNFAGAGTLGGWNRNDGATSGDVYVHGRTWFTFNSGTSWLQPHGRDDMDYALKVTEVT